MEAVVRLAVPSDLPQIFGMVNDLATHLDSGRDVAATAADIGSALGFSGESAARVASAPHLWCYVVEVVSASGTELAGMAVWFLNYSTWMGSQGIYLEDLIVRAEFRGHGFGTRLLGRLAQECLERGYPRLQWSVLRDNAAAVGFYDSLGAKAAGDWVGYTLAGSALGEVAAGADPPVTDPPEESPDSSVGR